MEPNTAFQCSEYKILFCCGITAYKDTVIGNGQSNRNCMSWVG